MLSTSIQKGGGYSGAAGYPFSIQPFACKSNGRSYGPMAIGHHRKDQIVGVLGIDIRLENLVKMEKNGELG